MNETLSNLAQEIQKQAESFIPKAYRLGQKKAQTRYGIVKPWGDRDNVNIALLLNRHAEELSKSMAKIDQIVSQGGSLEQGINSLLARVSSWAWVLAPALAMGLAEYTSSNRQEIAATEGISVDDIGIIWLTARDARVCPKCQYLNGRWFDAKQAYEVAATIHPGCRCPQHFDVGVPSEAMVGPIPGYRPGTAQDVYRDLNIEGLAKVRQSQVKEELRKEHRRHIKPAKPRMPLPV